MQSIRNAADANPTSVFSIKPHEKGYQRIGMTPVMIPAVAVMIAAVVATATVMTMLLTTTMIATSCCVAEKIHCQELSDHPTK